MADSSAPPADTPAPGPTRQVLLVTGLSGAGKTTALRVLEDLGWETIDNFPVRLLDRLIGEPNSEPTATPLAIGFDARTRGFVPADIIALVKALDNRGDLDVTTLFLDCSSAELERRYNETRRRHPLAHGRPVIDAIRAERELLDPLRRWAEMVVDTTRLTTNQLQQTIRESFARGDTRESSLTLTSFGFARGTPPLADLVFDMRFLDNPHWVPGLRELTGLDTPVGDHIRRDPAFADVFGQIRDLLLTLIPAYQRQGKGHIGIAFGCTGGKHRSVFTTEAMAQALREAGFSPTVIHRNLGSRAADRIEAPQH